MAPDQVTLVEDTGTGTLELSNGVRLRVADPDTPGDGTVPLYSGHAPAGKAGVAMCFAHGHAQPGKHNTRFGYDHQDSYNDKRVLFASLYAIIKIAQQAQWHTKPTSKDTS